tara:strand:+ start:245 stop:382 length:138 start_codon:yes stop_codon:yes gene_type:complete
MEYAYLLKAQPFIREHLKQMEAAKNMSSSNNSTSTSGENKIFNKN